MSLGLTSIANVAGEHFLHDLPSHGRAGYAARIPLQDRTYNGEKVVIDIATSSEHREVARQLINRRYSWRGYGSNHTLVSRSTHTTFTVSAGGEVLGTLTLAADSRQGLAADALFRDDIDKYRAVPNSRVCELTKLAFDTTSESKHLLAALFHIVFIYGVWKHHGTDLFIEVNPRHRRFYESMLGFKRLGDLKTNESVAAPSQLMWLNVADIRLKIDEHAGTADASSRSLYPLFLSSLEEADARLHLWSIFSTEACQKGSTADVIQIEAGATETEGYECHSMFNTSNRVTNLN